MDQSVNSAKFKMRILSVCADEDGEMLRFWCNIVSDVRSFRSPSVVRLLKNNEVLAEINVNSRTYPNSSRRDVNFVFAKCSEVKRGGK